MLTLHPAEAVATLREQLFARLRSRGADRLHLVDVARHCGVSVLALESFLSGAHLPPAALARLPELLAEKPKPPPVQPQPVSTNPPPKGAFMISARAIKATLVLDPAEIAALPEPTTSRVVLRIQVEGRAVTADIAAKSLRKAKAAIAEHGVDGVAVVLQGRLAANDGLAEAGLVAQVKLPKETASGP